MKRIDLTGQRFGRLRVIEECGRSKDGQKVYRCICDCGNETKVTSGNLRHAHTQSCGCIKREQTIKQNKESAKHGGCGTRLYGIWIDMRQRCQYQKSINWHLYGGRGINVCKEWDDNFATFRDWAECNGYEDGLQLDRIDVNGNYEPANCRWVDYVVQGNNRRGCTSITADGITRTIAEWARENNINPSTIRSRLRAGWEPARAVTQETRAANHG